MFWIVGAGDRTRQRPSTGRRHKRTETGTQAGRHPPHPPPRPPPRRPPRPPAPPPTAPVPGPVKPEPHFPKLGSYRRKITTTSPVAQEYFDQGLAFLYG